MGNLFCIGLILKFRSIPSPWGLDNAHHRLPACMNMDVLYRDLLLALAAVTIEGVNRFLGCGLSRLLFWLQPARVQKLRMTMLAVSNPATRL